jgi:hypothetical protein
MKVNFDTKAVLEWTPEARAAIMDEPRAGVYTSFSGLRMDLVPESYKRWIGQS